MNDFVTAAGRNGTTPLDPIPGPDPGACPDCGEWVKAGIQHECAWDVDEVARRLIAEHSETLRRLAEND